MSHLLTLLAAYLVVSLGYTLFSLKTASNHLFRLIALSYMVGSVVLALYFYNQLLSLPKPIDQEYFNNAKEAVVLAVRPKSDSAIYLWLQLPDRDYPTYYVMPWNGQAAGELEIAQKEAAEQEGLVLMKTPFKHNQQRAGMKGTDKDPVFYAAPPLRPPEKWGEQNQATPALQYGPSIK